MSVIPPDPAGMAGDAGELARRIAELDGPLQELGLYLTNSTIAAQASADGNAITVGVLVATIGRFAFSNHVQRPDQEATDDTFEEITESLVRDRYEQCLDDLHGGDDEPLC